MKAGDWNNLGYAYASLPAPNLKSAGNAFSKAQALTRDEELLRIIQHNQRVIFSAVSKAPGPVTNSELARRPHKVTIPLPDITYRGDSLPITTPDVSMKTGTSAPVRKKRMPKASAPSRAKKPGSKSKRR
jgi:hypothetical protein